VRGVLSALLLFATSGAALAQNVPPQELKDKPQEKDVRPNGLPTRLDWTFHFDAGWGSFGFGNSLFQNPKEDVRENLSDQWLEGYLKAGLTGVYTMKSSSEIYGNVSAAGERTYGQAPVGVGPDVSSFFVEDLAIGWRSGKAIEKLGENAVDISVGRIPYTLGHGFLVWDGTAEGGSRGGYWTNARKAFQFGTVGRVKTGSHTVEAFYLDKDELPEADSGSRLWGLNYEVAHGDATTIGATYLRTFATPSARPTRDGMNVFNVRAYTAPLPTLPDLSFEFEYANESNGDLLSSHAWTLQAGYQLSKIVWKPTLSYRYAAFQGDDQATPKNEAFDPLFVGFTDWGTWWQGEIAGEYFLSNSNLNSHRIRAHVDPHEKVGAGVIFYDFRIDQPAAYGPTVTDKHAAVETDGYVEWKLNSNILLTFVLAYASPGKAVEQNSGRTASFRYGMFYAAYSF